MNYSKQTKIGADGNCFETVLSNLLHIPLEQIPEFKETTWQRDVNEWLRQFGLAYIQIIDFKHWADILGIKNLYHEISGPSPRGGGIFHACVGVDGEVSFDPHPENEGLNEIEASGVFVVLEPWKFIEQMVNQK